MCWLKGVFTAARTHLVLFCYVRTTHARTHARTLSTHYSHEHVYLLLPRCNSPLQKRNVSHQRSPRRETRHSHTLTTCPRPRPRLLRPAALEVVSSPSSCERRYPVACRRPRWCQTTAACCVRPTRTPRRECTAAPAQTRTTAPAAKGLAHASTSHLHASPTTSPFRVSRGAYAQWRPGRGG
jgi:hypothetical protein